jgi:polyisoprenoid-binding protein YceI
MLACRLRRSGVGTRSPGMRSMYELVWGGARMEDTVIRAALMLVLISIGSVCSVAIAGSDAPVQFRLHAAESRVWFDADARLHTFRGATQQLTGDFTLRPGSPPQLVDATVTIDAASLDTGHPERNADMRQDFLEVGRFPTIEFRVGELLTPQPAAHPESWDLVLQGKLTVHGITRDIKVPTTVNLAAEQVIARGQTYLDMRDYNIRVPRLLLIPMKSEVLVGFEVVARPVR